MPKRGFFKADMHEDKESLCESIRISPSFQISPTKSKALLLLQMTSFFDTTYLKVLKMCKKGFSEACPVFKTLLARAYHHHHDI
jgi:hypothetical protein